MSVETTADNKIKEAKKLISQAWSCLVDATCEDTWGSNDYSNEYKDKLEDSLIMLRKIQKML